MENLAGEFLKYCQANNLDKVRDCLSRGVDVNTVSQDGRSSGLTIAARMNHTELLEILLSHPHIKINKTINNNSYNKPGTFQWTALMVACNRGNSAIVSRLVQVPGLDINYQTEDGGTAAWLACRKCHTECVRILAQTDRVDWNKADEWGRTPLCWALFNGRS